MGRVSKLVTPEVPKRPALDQRIVNLITDQWGVDDDEVTPDASFSKDLGADSLDCVELVIGLEEEFNIVIDDEDAEGIDTLQALVALLVKKGVKV